MGISAQGTKIYRNGVAIDELGDITPPPLTRVTKDSSIRANDDEAVQVGRRAVGMMMFDLNWVYSKHSALITSWSTGVIDSWEILFPDGSTWFFTGAIDDLSSKAPVDGKLMVRVAVSITGGVTFVAPIADLLLLETGDGLLLETGDGIAL